MFLFLQGGMITGTLRELGIERIMPLLLAEGGQRTVAGTNDRWIRKREDLHAVVRERLGDGQ